ncbi:hypothetical protein P280DRAFT_6887 [Massarina eburnea CBS 473.64]|uniref:Velvet domain-containing protein n=1 Tax=Massarina eburnea CBS 473.64 TaxID=1395130 RepID=A0A6A6SEP1_9PLEO|nr:hypothetical protein P280DRAFT_6887 [Massarina eburnea CBS 473.64]
MQRGRGQGRGRNSNPARSTSRRGTSRSNSRTATSRGRSRASIRRSARIAEILNNELQNSSSAAPAASLMANVVQTRGFGSTSVASRHHSGNGSRRTRSNRETVSPADIRYAMDIVVQPPSSARAGYAINGTIVVRLRTTNMYADDVMEDSQNLFAFASLVSVSNSSASDARTLDRSLGGRRYVSVHAFSDDEADGSIAAMELDDPQGVGYMNFPDLSIHQAGTFRIRITLIRVPSSGTPSIAGGQSIQAIDSNPITVQGSGPTPRTYGKYMRGTY